MDRKSVILLCLLLGFTSTGGAALTDSLSEPKPQTHFSDNREAEIFMKINGKSGNRRNIHRMNGKVVWLYTGFVPRVQDFKRAKVVVSYKGLTARVSLQLNKEDIENYASYLLERSETIERVRQGDFYFPWSYTGPMFSKRDPKERFASRNPDFEIINFARSADEIDSNADLYWGWQNYIQTVVRPVAEGRTAQVQGISAYQANLNLLKFNFPYKFAVIEDPGVEQNQPGAYVHFHQVFPITGAAGGPDDRNAPKIKAGYGMYKDAAKTQKAKKLGFVEILEYREKYSKNSSNIFLGFPFLQVDYLGKGSALHAPVRYVEDYTKAHDGMAHGEKSELDGHSVLNRDWDLLADQTQVRWSLIRTFASGGCGRMEHVITLRNMLPVDSHIGSDGNIIGSLLPDRETLYRTAQPSMQQVGISLQKDFDYFDFDGDGVVELVGVDYYRDQHSHTLPFQSMDDFEKRRSSWIQRFYQNPRYSGASKPQVDDQLCVFNAEDFTAETKCKLAEFPYQDPRLVQVLPKNMVNERLVRQALTTIFNRVPLTRANKDQERLFDNPNITW